LQVEIKVSEEHIASILWADDFVGLLGYGAEWIERWITGRKMEAVCSSETFMSTSRHGVTTQKTNIDIFTALKQ
jgi:hypothetical protein